MEATHTPNTALGPHEPQPDRTTAEPPHETEPTVTSSTIQKVGLPLRSDERPPRPSGAARKRQELREAVKRTSENRARPVACELLAARPGA